MSANRVNEDGAEQADTGNKDKPSRRVRSNGKLPWMPFWYLDWKSDPCLAKCSMAAQGLWLRMCIDMFIDDESGEIEGTVKMLARSYGVSTTEFIEWINELAESGTADIWKIGSDRVVVFLDGVTHRVTDDGVTDGVTIHNRRMRKATNKSKLCSEAGKKGAILRWGHDRVTEDRVTPSGEDRVSLSLPLTLHSTSNSNSALSEEESNSKSKEEKAPAFLEGEMNEKDDNPF
jgi:hypothetical protein